MSSRVDKYYSQEENALPTRTQRNTELYKEIGKTDVGNYEIKSNATVIGNNSNNIDVEKIKSILDTHYNDTPRRRTIPIEEDTIKIPKQEYETKEYDINVILDKAKEDKIEDYNEERKQKLHNTQYDILSNLNINKDDYIEDYEEDNNKSSSATTAKKLEELINTISLNEKEIDNAKKKDEKEKESTDPLDIFEELKGDDNTAILDGLQEKTEKVIEKLEKTSSLDNSFFTKSNNIKSKDFEDEEFKDIDEEGPSLFAKIFIIIMSIAFVIGIIFLVKILTQ